MILKRVLLKFLKAVFMEIAASVVMLIGVIPEMANHIAEEITVVITGRLIETAVYILTEAIR